MMGDPQVEHLKGIIPRTFSHIVNFIESEGEKDYLVRCSFLEIYNEEIHDLLSRDCRAKLELKENPDKEIFVKDLSKLLCKTVPDMENIMEIGNRNKSVGETAMNKDSSRSHTIFTLYIEV